MKEQDWPYRYDNGCKINMVQILKTVWFGTNYRGYTPTGSILFARTLYQVNPLSQLYIFRIVRKGIFKPVRWNNQKDDNYIKACVRIYGNQFKDSLL